MPIKELVSIVSSVVTDSEKPALIECAFKCDLEQGVTGLAVPVLMAATCLSPFHRGWGGSVHPKYLGLTL